MAAKAGRSLNDFIEEAVRLAVRTSGAPSGKLVELPVFRGGHGPRPGVNLDSASSLLDLMDEDRSRA